jgi:hypothetical protein
MKGLGKIVGVNLLILLIYSIICKVFGVTLPKNRNNLYIYIPVGVVWMAYIIIFHTLVCFFVGAFSKDVKQFKSFLLAALLILLIGFGTCVNLF